METKIGSIGDAKPVSANAMEQATRTILILVLMGLAAKNVFVGHLPLATAVAGLDVILTLNLVADLTRSARPVSSRVLAVVLAVTLIISTTTLGLGGSIWAFPALVGARILGSRRASVAMALLLSTALPAILAYQGETANAARLFGALFLTSFYVVFAQGHVPTIGEALDHSAMRDPLTKVFNRSHLDRAISTLKPQETAGVLMVAIENFHDLNQRCGRSAGDDLLCQVADAMHGFLGEREQIFRVGHAEFVILLKGWSGVEAKALADRIQGSFETEQFSGGSRLTITASTVTGGDHAASVLQGIRAQRSDAREAV